MLSALSYLHRGKSRIDLRWDGLPTCIFEVPVPPVPGVPRLIRILILQECEPERLGFHVWFYFLSGTRGIGGTAPHFTGGNVSHLKRRAFQGGTSGTRKKICGECAAIWKRRCSCVYLCCDLPGLARRNAQSIGQQIVGSEATETASRTSEGTQSDRRSDQ